MKARQRVADQAPRLVVFSVAWRPRKRAPSSSLAPGWREPSPAAIPAPTVCHAPRNPVMLMLLPERGDMRKEIVGDAHVLGAHVPGAAGHVLNHPGRLQQTY